MASRWPPTKKGELSPNQPILLQSEECCALTSAADEQRVNLSRLPLTLFSGKCGVDPSPKPLLQQAKSALLHLLCCIDDPTLANQKMPRSLPKLFGGMMWTARTSQCEQSFPF